MSLRLSKDLTLPLEAVTQTFLIVGKRGSGKTSTAVRLAEQFAHAGVPFVVLDPADAWWGLKASKDGKQPGFSVYVFGGRHGDLPLEPTAGALMADVVMEHRFPVVLSIKHFSGGERTRFVTEFASRLYQQNTEPLHLFLEEAHEVAPQHPYKGEEPMLGAIQRIWKLGRSSGLGGSAITQRPASLNKNITTQAEVLIVHRTIGPQDVAAIREWIKYHGEREDVLAELATLKTGEAFVWAPDFPEKHPIGLKRVTILERETFDSSATPRAGERQKEPKALAPVDLERLRSRMTATIERAKAEDPRELRRRIIELERDIASKKASKKENLQPTKEKRVDIPFLKDAQIKRIESALARVEKCREPITAYLQAFDAVKATLGQAANELMRSVNAIKDRYDGSPARTLPQHPIVRTLARPTLPSRSSPAPGAEHSKFSSSQQRILNALAWLESIRITSAKKVQVALLADQSPTSGGYFNNLGALRSSGHICYPVPSTVSLTDSGRAVAVVEHIPTTSEELHEQIFRRLSRSQGEILRTLIAAYPHDLSKQALAEQAGQSPTSGGYFNNLGRLRSLGLLTYPSPGRVVAQSVLFLER